MNKLQKLLAASATAITNVLGASAAAETRTENYTTTWTADNSISGRNSVDVPNVGIIKVLNPNAVLAFLSKATLNGIESYDSDKPSAGVYTPGSAESFKAWLSNVLSRNEGISVDLDRPLDEITVELTDVRNDKGFVRFVFNGNATVDIPVNQFTYSNDNVGSYTFTKDFIKSEISSFTVAPKQAPDGYDPIQNTVSLGLAGFFGAGSRTYNVSSGGGSSRTTTTTTTVDTPAPTTKGGSGIRFDK